MVRKLVALMMTRTMIMMTKLPRVQEKNTNNKIFISDHSSDEKYGVFNDFDYEIYPLLFFFIFVCVIVRYCCICRKCWNFLRNHYFIIWIHFPNFFKVKIIWLLKRRSYGPKNTGGFQCFFRHFWNHRTKFYFLSQYIFILSSYTRSLGVIF